MRKHVSGVPVSVWAFLLGVAPLPLYGFSSGPPPLRTGAAVDGGLNCTACHRTFAPANSGKGNISITSASYTPGAKLNILITLQDPDAQRWGFQLTARLRSDETKEAGTFTVAAPLRVRCENGDNAPCGGGKEFIEHTAAATQVGTRNQGSFTIEWTAPEQDVGEIVLYAAGNAANGDGTPNGDHIYTTSAVIRPACTLTQKPAIKGVTDAASFQSTISPNSLISVFGGPFPGSGYSYSAYASDLAAGRWPTSLGCVAVEIGGQRVPVFFVSQGQINAQAPPSIATGPADVTVILNPGAPNEVRSLAAKTQVANHSPAFFQVDSKHIAAVDASNQNLIIGVQGAAKPGDIVTMFGTGFGGAAPPLAAGEFPSGPTPLHDPVTVVVGGITLALADLSYAGLSPWAPGVCQFNIRLPASLPSGDIAVKIRIGSAETQDGAVLAVSR